MYHAIFDLQTGNYLATGLNTKSLKELFDDYCEYKSGDAFDENEWRNHFNSLAEYEKYNFILSDDFEIEIQEEPFEEWW